MHFLKKLHYNIIKRGDVLVKPIKKYEDLTIRDNFLFQKIMRNKRICKRVIENLLDIEINDITYPEEEKTISLRLDSKTVRLDVYVNDDKGTVFNLEMQTVNDKDELAKRTRYYQASIDIDMLEHGSDYSDLKQTYIIFICTFPIFDKKRQKYTFRNICIEDHDVELKDETSKVFVTSKGNQADLSKPLKMFLDYVDGKVVDDGFIKEIDNEIQAAKNRDEWRREYMTLEMEIKRREKASFTEGKLEGKLDSYRKMIASGLVTIEQIIASGQLNSKEIAALK